MALQEAALAKLFESPIHLLVLDRVRENDDGGTTVFEHASLENALNADVVVTKYSARQEGLLEG